MERIPDDRYQNLENQLGDEKLFISILENVNSGVALIDETGQFILYNKRFLNLFGLSEESTIKNVNDQNWSDWQVFNENLEILHVDDHPVRKAAITGNNVTNQLVAVKLPSGGDLIWMLVSAEPIFKNGKIEMTICTYTDITEHKLADIALRKSEHRYSQLFNSMTEMFQVIEIIHDENGKAVDYYYRDINPAFEKLAGKKREELLDNRARQVFPDIKQHLFDVYDSVYKTGNSIRFESHGDILNKDFEIYAWKTLENNIGVILSDVTERKKTQDELIESEQNLRELNATKDKFFSIIAHDLKSPFTSIIGFTELLTDKIKKNDYEGIEEFADIIHKSSWRAMDLLSNLIEWSRMQTGRMEFNPQKINMILTINEVTDLLKDSAHQKLITISKDVPSSLDVFADKSMISTILRNLLSNAIKFTSTGGKIIISGVHYDNEVRISVMDNGKGIRKEILEMMFRMENSFSTPGTNGEEGTGLGLLLCKEFVSEHGGSIWVESTMGEGSTFSFTLPQVRM